MGKLGRFITNGKETPFYARKVFELKKEVKSATAKVCGLGQFLFYLNGKKVEDHELDPGWTDYRKTMEYVTFDVKDYLVVGKNALGAEVGNGWFLLNTEHYTFTFPGFMPKNPNPYKPFAKSLMLALVLEVEYVDGEKETFSADDSFLVKDHFVTQSNVYGSETMDAGLKQENFSCVDFDAQDWEKAALVPENEVPQGELKKQEHPPIKVIHRYEAKKIGVFGNREIYDLGQNVSGMLEITIAGKKGDFVKVSPAEKLKADGDVDFEMKGWTTLKTVITCILGEKPEETFRSKFTYFAGRYFSVEKSGEQVEVKAVIGDAISSAWKKSGTFRLSDARYEQIYDLVEKAVEANMVSVHTDCPTIERFAWQEPNHLMAPSVMFMKDGNQLWRKFFSDMRDEQHGKEDFFYDYEGNKLPAGDGLIPSQCPCYIPNFIPVPGMGSFYDIIPWGSALILGAKWHYLFYGEKDVLQENLETAEKYFAYLLTKVNEQGFINHGLGDWGNPNQENARENVETAFLYADAKALQYFAEELELPEKAKIYEEKAEEIKNHYNAVLLKEGENGEYYYPSFEHPEKDVVTLGTLALPLYFGMVPEDKIPAVEKCFARVLEETGALAAGEIAMPYIIQTARKCGMNDVLSRFILKEQHPSYYAFVKDGLTTLGEYWEENPRSQCHDMMGHIIEWYYNGIAGIQPLKPGFAEVEIKPYLPESVEEFTCTYESVKGEILVHVKKEQQQIRLEVKTPETMKVSVSTEELEKTGLSVLY